MTDWKTARQRRNPRRCPDDANGMHVADSREMFLVEDWHYVSAPCMACRLPIIIDRATGLWVWFTIQETP